MELDPTELALLRSGDIAGLAACHRAYGARLHRLAHNLLDNAADAEDAVQEVFLKVHERAHTYAGDARFSTWLYRLTVNHCLHRLEKSRVRRAEPLPAPDDASWHDDSTCPVNAAHTSETRERLRALLARLGPDQRAILLLREIEGLSYREIADVLSIPAGTVMSRLARARERLIALVDATTARTILAEPKP